MRATWQRGNTDVSEIAGADYPSWLAKATERNSQQLDFDSRIRRINCE